MIDTILFMGESLKNAYLDLLDRTQNSLLKLIIEHDAKFKPFPNEDSYSDSLAYLTGVSNAINIFKQHALTFPDSKFEEHMRTVMDEYVPDIPKSDIQLFGRFVTDIQKALACGEEKLRSLELSVYLLHELPAYVNRFWQEMQRRHV